MSLFDQATTTTNAYRDVTPTQVANARTNERMIDVREPNEYTGELGHIRSTELVPLATVTQVAAGWDRNADLILICRSGNRSGRAAQALTEMGFLRVMNMVGGMLAYHEQKLPVE